MAVMVLLPAVSFDVLKIAVPWVPWEWINAVPRGVVPSMNVTVPVGVETTGNGRGEGDRLPGNSRIDSELDVVTVVCSIRLRGVGDALVAFGIYVQRTDRMLAAAETAGGERG